MSQKNVKIKVLVTENIQHEIRSNFIVAHVICVGTDHLIECLPIYDQMMRLSDKFCDTLGTW